MDIEITTTTNNPVSLTEFKAYIVEYGTGRDTELQTILDSALRAVEQHHNKSFADHDITMYQDRKVEHQKLYYRPVTSVTSVKDMDGDNLVYTTELKPRTVNIEVASNMVIEYKTSPLIVPETVKQCIKDYAALVYNGSTEKTEFISVLKKYYNPIM